MNNNGHNIEKTNFDAFINAVGSEIQQAQVRLITAANAQMLFHYWKMGNYILYHQQLHGWGSKTIKQLAKAIRFNYPEKKGLEKPLNFAPFGHAELSLLAKI
jgi:nicotinamidase-related amidase